MYDDRSGDNFIAEGAFEHHTYSPDLAPNTCSLCSALKQNLGSNGFKFDLDMLTFLTRWLITHDTIFCK